MQALLFTNVEGIVYFLGLVWLQVYFSKKDQKIFGLIMPGIFFGYSLYVLWATTASSLPPSLGHMGILLFTLFLLNIPSLILLLIYRSISRKKGNEETIDFHLQKYL